MTMKKVSWQTGQPSRWQFVARVADTDRFQTPVAFRDRAPAAGTGVAEATAACTTVMDL